MRRSRTNSWIVCSGYWGGCSFFAALHSSSLTRLVGVIYIVAPIPMYMYASIHYMGSPSHYTLNELCLPIGLYIENGYVITTALSLSLSLSLSLREGT